MVTRQSWTAQTSTNLYSSENWEDGSERTRSRETSESLCAASVHASESPNIPSTWSHFKPGSGSRSHRQSSSRLRTMATKGRSPCPSAKADGRILRAESSSSDTQIYPVSDLPSIDPPTSAGTRTPSVDPPAPTGTPSVDPSAAARTPSVDPNPSIGLWRECKPGTAKSHRRNCRTGPFPDAPEEKASVQGLLFVLGASYFRRWQTFHNNRTRGSYSSS